MTPPTSLCNRLGKSRAPFSNDHYKIKWLESKVLMQIPCFTRFFLLQGGQLSYLVGEGMPAPYRYIPSVFDIGHAASSYISYRTIDIFL